MTHYHPRPDNKGQPVQIHKPSNPAPINTWSQPQAHATVTPDGEMPEQLNGIEVSVWTDAPRDSAGWNAEVEGYSFDELKSPRISEPVRSRGWGTV